MSEDWYDRPAFRGATSENDFSFFGGENNAGDDYGRGDGYGFGGRHDAREDRHDVDFYGRQSVQQDYGDASGYDEVIVSST